MYFTLFFIYSACVIPSVTPTPTQVPSNNLSSNSCGTSYDNAVLSCSIPCESGLDGECPDGQKCYNINSSNCKGVSLTFPPVQPLPVQPPVQQVEPPVEQPVLPPVLPPVQQPVQPVQQNNPGSKTSIVTYYFRVGPDVEGCAPVQNFDDGNAYGPCNGNQGVKYTSESKYWVAINGAKDYCGKQIRVNYEGRTLDLTIMDQCPGCGAGNTKIDIGLESLIELTGSKEVACSIGRLQPEVTWDFI